MTVSVIIPTKDRWKQIYQCIESLVNQTVLPNTIIIIDASEKEGLNEYLRPLVYVEKIEFIYIHSEPGLTRQRNIGIERNKNDVVLFLDDDVVLDENFLKIIIDFFENNPDVMGVTGKILNQPSLPFISSLIRRIFFLPEVKRGEIKLSGANNDIHAKINRPITVNWLKGGCSAYRKNVFLEFRFDNLLSGYSYLEDVDFSYRVQKKYPLMYIPEATLYHYHMAAPETRLSIRKKHKMFAINYHYFFKKNMPQTLKYKLAHYWSLVGLVVKDILLTRNVNAIVATLEGIWLNISGKNPLVNHLKNRI